MPVPEDVLAALAAWRSGDRGALATVVRVDGSAYRREGAQLLVGPGDRATGMLSGGCLEDDVTLHARRVLEAGLPRLLAYDMRADGDDVWGLGLGCNGAVEVFVQPLGPAVPPCAQAAAWLLEGTAVTVATVVESEGEGTAAPGTQAALADDGRAAGNVDDPALRALLDGAAGGPPRAATAWHALPGGGRLRVFLHRRLPAPVLAVFGAGADAPPLVELAARSGFRVLVVDHRPALARRERLPGAEEVLVARGDELPAALDGRRLNAAVVMTHSLPMDAEVIRYLLGRGLAYIGLLGPWARAERLLRMAGWDPGGGELPPGLYAPVGLDIGADTPEEIALSIVAEALAVCRGRSGGHLRGRRGAIHAPA